MNSMKRKIIGVTIIALEDCKKPIAIAYKGFSDIAANFKSIQYLKDAFNDANALVVTTSFDDGSNEVFTSITKNTKSIAEAIQDMNIDIRNITYLDKYDKNILHNFANLFMELWISNTIAACMKTAVNTVFGGSAECYAAIDSKESDEILEEIKNALYNAVDNAISDAGVKIADTNSIY